VTRRKPPAVTWESWVERQIREARERGQFDDLPGAGRPLASSGEPYDETWWVRDKARREQISLLPATLLVRKKAEHLEEHLHELRSEADVRAAVEALNTEIVHADRTAYGGPPSRLLPRDPDTVVAQWRDRRRELEPPAPALPADATPASARRRRTAWLRR
jgi:hypothetical protein